MLECDKRNRVIRIAVVVNSGGHLAEVRALEEAFVGHELHYITLKRPWTKGLPNAQYLIPPRGGRWLKLQLPWYYLRLLLIVPWLLTKLRPQVIVSTGAEIAIPAFWFGKLIGAKTVFVESVTRYDKPSWTGRVVMPVTDFFFAQQESLVAFNPQLIRYRGNIL